MLELSELAGQERSVREVSQAVYFRARAQHAPVVGALHVTCSDESEGEGVEAFQQELVQYLLPPLKFAHRSAFRTANLGGRYEWGAVRLAEQHFAAPLDKSAGKLLIVKVNAHVACEPVPGLAGRTGDEPPRLGVWHRYGRESPCCGALNALVVLDQHTPAIEDLREAFVSDLDRLSMIRDPTRVDPRHAALYAAMVSARLQARKVVLDIQDYTPDSPTLYAVLPSVTINRHERDTEMLCGVYLVDTREGHPVGTYSGLGDDPSAYELRVMNRLMSVRDEHVGLPRPTRDHRAMASAALAGRLARPLPDTATAQLERLRRDATHSTKAGHHHARNLLRIALPVLAEVAPVPAAILAFADGAAGIHHAFRIHRLARTMAGDTEARQVLDDVHNRIDELDAERAEALVELLTRDYRS